MDANPNLIEEARALYYAEAERMAAQHRLDRPDVDPAMIGPLPWEYAGEELQAAWAAEAQRRRDVD